MEQLAYLFDQFCFEHDPGARHVDSPARLRTVEEYLAKSNVRCQLDLRTCRPATRDQLKLIHTVSYIDSILEKRGVKYEMLDNGDTFISPASIDVALLGAGMAVEAVDLVFNQGYKRVFVAVRPPGHHARPNNAMGFCLFNNIALCAAHALHTQDISRVLIVDWDVHHGNGTQEMFYDSDSVFFLSLHQSPIFPNTGAAEETGTGPGLGFTRNLPLSPGKGDVYYTELLKNTLEKIEAHFKPDLVLISAGFDAHEDDPVGSMNITESGYYQMTQVVAQLAVRHAEGRVISFLEGGYNCGALARSVEAHLQGLLQSD